MFKFAYPIFFILLLGLFPWIISRFRGKKSSIKLPSFELLKAAREDWRVFLSEIGDWLLPLAMVFFIIAMARPQLIQEKVVQDKEIFDIILIIDTSRSMAAKDFSEQNKRESRLEAVKKVVEQFVEQRKGDRIGLVVFGTQAFTRTPLTADYEFVKRLVNDLYVGMAGDSTAIGNAIAVAANRMQSEKTKTKVAILLTDGENTAGDILPIDAAKAAKQLGIKIYSIGMGSAQTIWPSTRGFFGGRARAGVNFEELEKISALTGAKSFRANDSKSLMEIYQQIDQLEQTEIKVENYVEVKELYFNWLVAGSLFLVLFLIFEWSLFRAIP